VETSRALGGFRRGFSAAQEKWQEAQSHTAGVEDEYSS
jgi:hypothetical protein